MKRLYTLVCILSLSLITNAQHYYPAGLGNSNLQLWLTSADPTTLLTSTGAQATNNSSIATWVDKSGHGFNAVQGTNSNRPVFMTGQLNGLGAVIFQNNTQYMTGPAGAYQTIVSARAMFGNSYQYLFSSPSLTDFSIRFTGGAGTAAPTYTDGPNVNDWDYNTGTTPTQWVNGVQTLNATATHIIVDAALSPTNATYSISNTFLNRGMYNNDPVYELLAYNGIPNTTQRVLLENYEASEWGLVTSLPSSGYTRFIPPTKPTWNKNLVGIGYTSSTDNFLTDVAGSTDGLGFSSGTTSSDFLNTPGYVMAAHNAQTNTVNYNSGLPNVPVNSYVWNRSWYLRTSGGNSSGNVTLNFNFDDYNGTTPNSTLYYSILYNATDGTFATGTNKLVNITSAVIVAGKIVSFQVKAANLPLGYYTIVYNQNNVLPISLENFTVSKQSSASALAKWQVGADAGEDHFSLERSADGYQFASIATITGIGNGYSSQTYSYIDNSPLIGINYYRLLMTDASGVSSYSPVSTLVFDASRSQVTLYPIPAKDVLHVGAPGISGNASVNLISSSGQVLASYRFSHLDGSALPVSSLPAGSYIAYIQCGQRSYPIPFIKR